MTLKSAGSGSGEPNLPNLEDLLRLGISTAKQGNKESARVIFRQVLDKDKRNERAWLWLASVEEDSIERRRMLQTVLEMNPSNGMAKKLLAAMDASVARSEQASMMLGMRLLIVAIVVIAVAVVVIVIF